MPVRHGPSSGQGLKPLRPTASLNGRPPVAGGVPWGIAANVVATGAAAIAYGFAARAAQRRQRGLGRRLGPAAVFFAVIAVFLALAAARQLAAAGGWPQLDLAIYLANVPMAAFVIVPHSYLVAVVRTGSDRVAGRVAFGFLLVVTVGIGFALLGGVTEEPRTDFGTDWSLDSPVARILIVAAILLPGLVGSAWLLALARRLPEAERRRIRLVGAAALGYFVLFTIDAYGLSGPAFLAARVLTAGTGVLAYLAYRRPPAELASYSPPPEEPGQNPFSR